MQRLGQSLLKFKESDPFAVDVMRFVSLNKKNWQAIAPAVLGKLKIHQFGKLLGFLYPGDYLSFQHPVQA